MARLESCTEGPGDAKPERDDPGTSRGDCRGETISETEKGREGSDGSRSSLWQGRGKRRSSEIAERGTQKKRKISGNSDKSYTSAKSLSSGKGVAGKKRGKERQRAERQRPTTASETSPYFSQSQATCESDDSDADFVPAKSRARKVLFESASGESGEESEGEDVEKRQRDTCETGTKVFFCFFQEGRCGEEVERVQYITDWSVW